MPLHPPLSARHAWLRRARANGTAPPRSFGLRRAPRAWVIVLGLAGLLSSAAAAGAEKAASHLPASPGRGLILCIGDGMGWGALSVATLQVPGSTLLSGAGAVGALSTGSYDRQVTDSAAAATALASGRRTRNGWLGLDPETRAPLRTIAEEARRRGLAIGLVTTTTIVHATPAGFYAHVDDRYKYAEIARQLADFRFDFVAGGGRGYFVPRPAGGLREDGLDLLADLSAAGVQVATSLQQARGAAPGRLALLYSEDDPPPAGPQRPALRELMEIALRRLSADPDGFFLMVEGGQIDWAEHDQDAPHLVPELADFDPAVAEARRFAAAHRQVAVVVAADHDTGDPAPWAKDEPEAPLEIRFLMGEHTALLVPLLVNGPPARAWARARHHTDLSLAMREWLLGPAR